MLMRTYIQYQGVDHGTQSEDTEQLVDQEADHGNQIESEDDDAANDDGQGRMADGVRSIRQSASKPCEHDGGAKQRGTE
jgi:hypothetical protein